LERRELRLVKADVCGFFRTAVAEEEDEDDVDEDVEDEDEEAG
jgi:hypothetical protein